MSTLKFSFYCHTLDATGERYVGQTVRSMNERWKEHVSSAHHGGACVKFYAAIRAYGEDAFSHELLEVLTYEDVASALRDVTVGWDALPEKLQSERVLKVVCSIESVWIAQVGSLSPAGFNLLSYSTQAVVHEETKARISAGLRRTFQRIPPEVRRDLALKRAAAMTPEQRSAKVQKVWDRLTPEQRVEQTRRMSEGLTRSGHDRSAAGRAQWAAMSPEAKARVCESHRKIAPERLAASRLKCAEGHKAWLATTTPEWRLALSQKANAAPRRKYQYKISAEQRSEIAREASLSMTAEQRSEHGRMGYAKSLAARQSTSPEKRSEIARKAAAAQTPEKRSAKVRNVWANYTPEERAERVRRIYEGRNKKL